MKKLNLLMMVWWTLVFYDSGYRIGMTSFQLMNFDGKPVIFKSHDECEQFRKNNKPDRAELICVPVPEHQL